MSRSHNSGCASVPVLKTTVLAVGLALAGTAGATQLNFDNGISGSFDTTISAGVSVRAEKPDPTLIGIANGGTSRSVNEDDGDRNYKRGDAFSQLLKVTHDLELKQDTWGVFLRGLYFVDFKNRGNNNLGPVGRDRLASDAQILDAFVTKSFDVGGKSVRIRAGKQVMSWGESTFIGNSINVINAIDVSKLRVPGAELKEGLIPALSVSGNFELSKAASVEAFALFNHDKFKLDPRGSYFSNNDYALDDGSQVFLTFGRRKDLTGRVATNPIPPTTAVAGPIATALYGPFDPAAAVWAPRGPDRPASDHGQYGLAFRYLATELNNSEFGLYFVNYHSRTPFLSGTKQGSAGVTSILTGGPLNSVHNGTANYFAEFPEDIRLYGVSFNTQGPMGVALQGEFSYRPNQPLAYSGIELILAALGLPNLITGSTQIPGATVGATAAALVPNGTYQRGYARVKMGQFQMTGTKSFPSVIGADQGVLLGEIGYTRYSGLPTGQKFNAAGIFLPATAFGAAISGANAVQTDGFITENSWGYRLVGRLEYSNLVFGANVAPRVAFNHDVKGVSQTFNEGTKSYSLGTSFDWQKKLTLDLSYTSYFGGRIYCGTDSPATAQSLLGGQAQNYCSNANPIRDRDFYSAVVSYSF
ncbi:MAG: DUF1302 domain-containing protein [Betaproteobacteria bacterium]|nr:DUF1302 domain-containing protein [Betaproteobacteria bacterium]